MKKMLALLLAALMLFGASSALAANGEYVEFPVTEAHDMWDSMGMSAEIWASEGLGRVLIAALALYSYEMEYPENAGGDLVYDSHVAYDKDEDAFVIVVGFGNNTIVLRYSRSWEKGRAQMMEGMTTKETISQMPADLTFIQNTEEDFEVLLSTID